MDAGTLESRATVALGYERGVRFHFGTTKGRGLGRHPNHPHLAPPFCSEMCITENESDADQRIEVDDGIGSGEARL